MDASSKNRIQVGVFLGICIILIVVLWAFVSIENDSHRSAAAEDLSVSNVDSMTNSNSYLLEFNSNNLVSNGTSSTLNVAELEFEYDTNILSLIDIVPNQDLLSLDKQINNNTGVASIDIAQPNTDFPARTTLLTLSFSVNDRTNTQVILTNNATYGSPNVLDYSNSDTVFPLEFSSDGSSSSGNSSEPTQLTVYRFFNTDTGVHFYTGSTRERDKVINTLPQFNYEGASYLALKSDSMDTNTIPIYRFFNTDTGAHFYTASRSERNKVITILPQFNYEGIMFYGYKRQVPGASKPIYRFFNTDLGTHFYTASKRERDKIINTLPQFNYEGINYYVPK